MRKTFLIFTLLSICFSSKAQFDEIGLGVGVSFYFGDLAPKTDIYSTGIESLAASLSTSYVLGEYLAVRAQVSLLNFSGDDKFQKDEARRMRNLSFRNSVKEATVLFDLSLSEWLGSHYDPFQMHALLGYTYYTHNPQALLDGAWHDLQPLSTEGQGVTISGGAPVPNYKLSGFAVPIGFSLEYEVSEFWSVSLEYLHRFTFTDYLDDVSTTYPDLNALALAKGDIARRLSFRANEIDGNELTPVYFGRRGKSDENDAYSSLQIRFFYRLQGSPYYNKKNRY